MKLTTGNVCLCLHFAHAIPVDMHINRIHNDLASVLSIFHPQPVDQLVAEERTQAETIRRISLAGALKGVRM